MWMQSVWRQLAVAVALAMALGCASEEQRFREHTEQAEAYLEANQSQEALLELRSALKLRPNDVAVNFRLAEIFNGRGQLAEAAFFYGEAYRLDPENFQAALSQVMLLRGSDLERAREIVAEMIERDPSDPLGHIGRSQIALIDLDPEAALEAALTAVELGPDLPEPHSNMGVVHQARIRAARVLDKERPDDSIFEAALAAFDRAYELRRPQVRFREKLEKAHVLGSWPGRSDEATDMYREAVEEAAATGRGYYEEGALTRALDFAQSSKNLDLEHWCLTRLVELKPGASEHWRALARVEEEQGGSAQEVLERLVEQRPEAAHGYLLIAGHLHQQGKQAEARSYLQTKAEAGIEPARLRGRLAHFQLEDGLLDEARQTVQLLEAEHPGHPSTQLAASKLAVAEGRDGEAIEHLEALAERGIESEVELQLLAQARYRSGDLKGALEALDSAIAQTDGFDENQQLLRFRIQRDSGNCDVAYSSLEALLRKRVKVRMEDRVRVAECFYQAGRDDQGRKLLTGIAARKNAPLVAVLAYAMREGARSPKRAHELLEKALEQQPDSRTALRQLVGLELRLGRPQRALERLDEALAEEPDTAWLLLARSRVHLTLQDRSAARRDAEASYTADPDLPGSLVVLTMLDRAADKLPDAVARLEGAERDGHLDPARRRLLGQLYLQSGDRERARDEFERVLQLAPDDAEVKNDLAFILAEAGQDLERATQLAEQAQRAMPDHPVVADTLGYVYLRRGLPEPALQRFDFALGLLAAKGVERPDVMYHRGLALRALGRNAEAAEAFQQALSMDRDFPHADLARRELETLRTSENPG
jgi:tetratricopeptide (TPR) repeat protein